MSEQLTLAEIVGVFGIKGWLKVKLYLEQPETLRRVERLQLVPHEASAKKTVTDAVVTAVERQGKGYIIRLQGVDDRTAAEALRGFVLRADSTSLPATADDEIYWRDLIGLKVWCHQGGSGVLLGEIDHMLETGANDVAVLKPCEGSVDGEERLIPWLPGNVVTEVAIERQEVWVDWYIDA